jgi:hypothetical protein
VLGAGDRRKTGYPAGQAPPASGPAAATADIAVLGKLTRKGRAGQRRRITVDGLTFDSAAEHRRWCELLQLQKLGEIRDLELHKVFALEVNGLHVCKYIPDFVYVTRDGAVVVEDYKSDMTRKLAEYRIKRNLFEALHRIAITETGTRRTRRRPRQRGKEI